MSYSFDLLEVFFNEPGILTGLIKMTVWALYFSMTLISYINISIYLF
ncbi:MAG: hypothetical protein ACTSRP_02755 [Candidatus Helarchaeota archaeon]